MSVLTETREHLHDWLITHGEPHSPPTPEALAEFCALVFLVAMNATSQPGQSMSPEREVAVETIRRELSEYVFLVGTEHERLIVEARQRGLSDDDAALAALKTIEQELMGPYYTGITEAADTLRRLMNLQDVRRVTLQRLRDAWPDPPRAFIRMLLSDLVVLAVDTSGGRFQLDHSYLSPSRSPGEHYLTGLRKHFKLDLFLLRETLVEMAAEADAQGLSRRAAARLLGQRAAREFVGGEETARPQ
jgi:hypothetical protein